MVWNFFNRDKGAATEKGFFAKSWSFLSKSLSNSFKRLMGEREISPEALESLEELLLEADFGPGMSQKMIDVVHFAKILPEEDPLEKRLLALKELLMNECAQSITSRSQDIISQLESAERSGAGPLVVLMIGVNGSGKTTTTAKLAARAVAKGKKVLMVPADTFRAAALEQLKSWSQIIGCDFFNEENIKDPSAICYRALEQAKSNSMDLVLIDTAGRLQSKEPLMQELEKMQRSCEKVLGRRADATLIVIDAVTGQNAMSQGEGFDQALGLDGVILTKIDGGAKGGSVVQLMQKKQLPILYLGCGESVEDLKLFDLNEFIQSLLETKTNQPQG